MSKFKVDLPKERSSIIKVIGVGGGGSNAVNHMYRQGIIGVDFFVCNTDSQALERSPVPNKIQLGTSLTEGLGAGSNPEVGKNAALESIDEIIDLMGVNTKMIFVTAGMGGGTGTGAAPIIAKTAKDLGILTVGIITTPFSFEGPRRNQQSYIGISEMKDAVDALLVISNDKIKEMYSDFKLTRAFAQADDVLTIAAKGIAEIITTSGDGNVDFQDVRTAMTNSGKAIMGTGIAEGDDRAMKASHLALNSPLLDNTQIEGAGWLLINLSWGAEEATMEEIDHVMNFFQEKAGQEANLKFGWCVNEKLENKLSVTIIATGFGTRENVLKKENTEVRLPLVETKEEIVQPIVENTVAQENHQVEEIVFKPLSTRDEERQQEVRRDLFTYKPSAEEEEVRVHQLHGEPMEDKEAEHERLERKIKRAKYLAELNAKRNDAEGMVELEREPAYKRKEFKLDPISHSSESDLSSTLSLMEKKDEEGTKTEFKTDNNFLHGMKNID